MLNDIGIGSEDCSKCGEKVLTVYFYNKMLGKPICAACLAKDAEEARAKLPQLEPGKAYLVKVNAYREARYEGSYDEVSVEFVSRFVHWATDGEEEYAIFGNNVKVGPRSNLGVSWFANLMLGYD